MLHTTVVQVIWMSSVLDLLQSTIMDSFARPFHVTTLLRRFLPPQQLQRVFQDAGVDLGKPVVASCGTGVTASVLALALEQLPQSPPAVAVYDGSWTEWGAREDLPKATGKA
jgi:thiosulfate/3-mercaptopyruvate sulfurtransferase